MTTEKIKADEILNDSELEKVAGGYRNESLDDMNYIRSNCGVNFGHTYESEISGLRDLYMDVGIRFHAYENRPNEYYDSDTGLVIARSSALQNLKGYLNGK